MGITNVWFDELVGEHEQSELLSVLRPMRQGIVERR
jgi:hypothetical protein